MQLITMNGGLDTLNTIDEIKYACSIDADEKGHVATVTAGGELFILKERGIISKLQLDDAEEIFTTCSFSPDGLLYVGTSENNIYVYDISEDTLKENEVLQCEDLSHINKLYFAENEMFVCTDNGIGYFNP